MENLGETAISLSFLYQVSNPVQLIALAAKSVDYTTAQQYSSIFSVQAQFLRQNIWLILKIHNLIFHKSPELNFKSFVKKEAKRDTSL